MNLYFKKTCDACPQQYDVLDLDDNERQVAYVRLRWGVLRVDVPDVGGETIYTYSFSDGYKGIMSTEESEEQMPKIKKSILKYYKAL